MPKRKPPDYFRVQTSEGWIASAAGVRKIGWLSYVTAEDSYRASSTPQRRDFKKAGRGKWGPGDSPISRDGQPRGHFLMLLALRAGASPELPLIREAQYLRTAAVHRILDEREAETGKSVPKKVRNNARDVANSWAKFESWAGSHFTLLFEDDDLHESFKRYSHWIPVINRILNDPPDPSDEVFLRAVERSAKDSGGVPTVKAVRTAFNDSRPQNLEGSGSTFRTLKTKLGFDWLPSAPPPGRPKSVGKK